MYTYLHHTLFKNLKKSCIPLWIRLQRHASRWRRHNNLKLAKLQTFFLMLPIPRSSHHSSIMSCDSMWIDIWTTNANYSNEWSFAGSTTRRPSFHHFDQPLNIEIPRKWPDTINMYPHSIFPDSKTKSMDLQQKLTYQQWRPIQSQWW